MLLEHYTNGNYDIELDLHFLYDLTLVFGDSATGKTLFYNLMRAESVNNKQIVCLDLASPSEVLRPLLKETSDKLIVIDNADVLLDNNARHYITSNRRNQYIILGRNPYGLGVGRKNYAEFVIADDKVTVEYKFI